MTEARWDANAYHVVSAPQLAWGLKVLERLSLRGDEVVLDAGCGTGRLTEKLLERLPNGHVVALDRDEAMIAKAREHLARFVPRVTFVQTSLLELPPDLRVDVVFSTATFHWIPDHDRLFEGLFTALRPGGRLVAQCGGAGNLRRVLERLGHELRDPEVRPYFEGVGEPWYYARAEETKARLARVGFVDVETWLEPAPTRFASRDELRTFCDRVILGQRLAPLADERLRTRVVDRVVDRFVDDDPPCVLDYVRLNMSASKR